jgi:hypothetical protein
VTDDKVISLGNVRAHQQNDARAWTPLEALKALVRDIEAGAVNPVAMSAWYWHKNADGSTSLHYSAAGLTHEQHVAMLLAAQHDALKSWRGS